MKQEEEEPIDIVPSNKLHLLHIIYEYMKSVQKCRNLIRCGKSSSVADL